MATPEEQLQQGMNENLEIPKNQNDVSNVTNQIAPTQKDLEFWQVRHRIDPVKFQNEMAKRKHQSDIFFAVGGEEGKKLLNDDRFKKMSMAQQKQYVGQLSRPEYKNLIVFANKENMTSKQLLDYRDANMQTWGTKELNKWQTFYDRYQDEEDQKITDEINARNISPEMKQFNVDNKNNRKYWRAANRNYGNILDDIKTIVGNKEELQKLKQTTGENTYKNLEDSLNDDLVYDFDTATNSVSWKNIGTKDIETIRDNLYKFVINSDLHTKILQEGGMWTSDEDGNRYFDKFPGLISGTSFVEGMEDSGEQQLKIQIYNKLFKHINKAKENINQINTELSMPNSSINTNQSGIVKDRDYFRNKYKNK